MFVAIALISNSRALMKAETSRSPFLFNALSDVCARIVLAAEILTRLAEAWGGGFLEVVGPLRFNVV